MLLLELSHNPNQVSEVFFEHKFKMHHTVRMVCVLAQLVGSNEGARKL